MDQNPMRLSNHQDILRYRRIYKPPRRPDHNESKRSSAHPHSWDVEPTRQVSHSRDLPEDGALKHNSVSTSTGTYISRGGWIQPHRCATSIDTQHDNPEGGMGALQDVQEVRTSTQRIAAVRMCGPEAPDQWRSNPARTTGFIRIIVVC